MEGLLKEAAARTIDEQIELHFALGKAYDDVAQYANAFHHWLEGNALKRRQIDYDEAAALAEMDQVCSAFTAELNSMFARCGPCVIGSDIHRRHAALGLNSDRADPFQSSQSAWGWRVTFFSESRGRHADGIQRIGRE